MRVPCTRAARVALAHPRPLTCKRWASDVLGALCFPPARDRSEPAEGRRPRRKPSECLRACLPRRRCARGLQFARRVRPRQRATSTRKERYVAPHVSGPSAPTGVHHARSPCARKVSTGGAHRSVTELIRSCPCMEPQVDCPAENISSGTRDACSRRAENQPGKVRQRLTLAKRLLRP